MTQSVVPKTSIPEKTWRRQTDSPMWWIAFSCGSVILHLLAFWFLSSYKLSASQSGSGSAVPIEFIEISPPKPSSVQPKSQPKPKAVLPKPAPVKPIVPQNSEQSVKPPVSTVDRDAISFNNQKIEQQLAEQERYSLLQQQKLAEQQRQLEIEQQRQLELEQQRLRAEALRQRQQQQEDLEAQIRQQEQKQQQELDEKLRQEEAEQQRQLETQRQQEAEQQRQLEIQKQQEAEQQRQLEIQKQKEAEEQRQLEAQRQQEAEQQRKLANPADGERILDGPKNAEGEEPPPEFDKKTAQAPIQNQPNQSGGILTASWSIDNSFTPKNDIPDNPPQLKQNISQNFLIKPLPNSSLKPVDFEVYLIINEQGIIEFAQITDTQMRRQYQTYVDQNLLNKQLFLPATDIDPRTGEIKPRRSESRIRIKIQ